ncbi:MAG TPA: branched-chain amino acid ABC transporter permease [Alphaproteobacteria bacterium]|nr:branched-chain amino acid ABC transporter permease [Alphaproteobacteria bacterium]
MMLALAEQAFNGVMLGAVYVLVALGLMLVYGVLRVLNFAHGALVMLGGYLCQFVFSHVVASYPLAIAGSIVALLPVGWALERGVFAPLRDDLQNQVIASLGLVLVIENLVLVVWGPAALQFRLATTQVLVPFGALRFSLQQFLVIGAGLACVAALFAFLNFTKFGTAVRATAQHPGAALVVGIDVGRVHAVTFAIGTALAAMAGSLLGPLFLVFPQMGDGPLLKGLAAIILGGLGSVWGAVIGGFAIGIVEAVSTLVVPTDYRDAVAFIVIAGVLLLRPHGLFGRTTRYEA